MLLKGFEWILGSKTCGFKPFYARFDLFSFTFGLEMRENLVPEQRLRGLRGFDQRSFKRTAYVILGQAPDAWMMPCVSA